MVAHKGKFFSINVGSELLYRVKQFVGGMLSLNMVVQTLKMLNALAGQMT